MKSHPELRGWLGGGLIVGSVLFAFGAAADKAGEKPREKEGYPTQTVAELVATYDTLADTILATKKTEENLVKSILATTYAHARSIAANIDQKLKAGDAAATKKSFEDLAELVGQLATEGDNSVGKVRKRLLEGGHHHNAAGEAKGIYEEGYVIVTRAAKKTLLEASQAIAQLSRGPTAQGLEANWKKVEETYGELVKPKK